MSGMTAPEAVPAAEQHHHGTISGFLHALPHLLKSPTKCSPAELLERLEDPLPTVQTKACNVLAAYAKESPEKLQEIKAAGGAEALESLRVRTHSQTVKVAALDALVALQSKAAVLPLVQLMEGDDAAEEAPKQKHRDLKNWACDSLHDLLKTKGSLQTVARDAGAVPALAKLERRSTTKELLHILGPADSHHVRNSRVSRGYSCTLDIPDAFPEATEEDEAAAMKGAKAKESAIKEAAA